MADILGSAIHTERLRQHLTQGQLADKAGVSRHVIGRIERGHPHAELALVLKLIDALDLQITITPRPTYTDTGDYLKELLGDA